MPDTHVHFIGARECKYRIDGKNLVEYRRARLRLMATKIGVYSGGTKSDLVRRIITRLDSVEAETDLPKALLEN